VTGTSRSYNAPCGSEAQMPLHAHHSQKCLFPCNTKRWHSTCSKQQCLGDEMTQHLLAICGVGITFTYTNTRAQRREEELTLRCGSVLGSHVCPRRRRVGRGRRGACPCFLLLNLCERHCRLGGGRAPCRGRRGLLLRSHSQGRRVPPQVVVGRGRCLDVYVHVHVRGHTQSEGCMGPRD
jgi:hypothetical protein